MTIEPRPPISFYYPSRQVIAYLLGMVSVLALPACSREAPAMEKRPVAVRVEEVRVGPMRETIRYVGTVHSQNEITVLARAQGKVAELPVEEGGQVERGDVLVTIAAPETGARLSRIRADTTRMKEESSFLCDQARIESKLLSEQVVSEVQASSSRQKCASSAAALKASRAAVREQSAMAENTVERAPFDGQVLRWLSNPGENVMPGRPVLMLGNDPLEVRVMVHERDLSAGIGAGTPVILGLPRGDSIRAVIERFAPMATGPGRMFEAIIPLGADQRDHVHHGESMDVRFVVGEVEVATTVPVAALGDLGDGHVVYVIRDGIARSASVVPGIREGDRVEIDADLKDGDHVAVTNLKALKDGLAVYPVEIDGARP